MGARDTSARTPPMFRPKCQARRGGRRQSLHKPRTPRCRENGCSHPHRRGQEQCHCPPHVLLGGSFQTASALHDEDLPAERSSPLTNSHLFFLSVVAVSQLWYRAFASVHYDRGSDQHTGAVKNQVEKAGTRPRLGH